MKEIKMSAKRSGITIPEIEEVSERIINPVLSILKMVEKIFNQMSNLFARVEIMVRELRHSKIDNTVDSVGDLLVNRVLMRELRTLGLGVDWYRLVIGRPEHSIWLKNTSGVYVAINRTMFENLNLEKYDDVLGKTTDEIIHKVYDDEDSSELISVLTALDKALKVTNNSVAGVVFESGNAKIFKYTILDTSGKPLAVFGMLIENKFSKDDSFSIKTIFEEEIRDILNRRNKPNE